MRTIFTSLPLVPVLLATAPLNAAQFQFCWVGANGYTIEGLVEFPDTLQNTGLITEADVTGFQIIGFLDGIAIGSWSLSDLTPQTSWTLRFDTTALRFPTGGIPALDTYQEWNANGEVNNCGLVDGFGFNGGNYAQDVCINNVWIEESSIDPSTPLFAQPMEVALQCETTIPIS